jgi:rhodanese-related sulfurtransferase/polyisoprenoid-binding protein YceI
VHNGTVPRPIDAKELRRWMDEGRAFTLLDVLPKEAFEELRLPGARCACVYEVTFPDQAAKAAPDRAAAVVVYGSSRLSHEASDAADRLEAAGYRNVHVFRGGREAWQEAGLAFEGAAKGWIAAPPSPLPDGEHAVDAARSVVEWTGRNVASRHFGTLRVAGGSLRVRDGRLDGGRVDLDMTGIEVGDLSGELAATLKRHLEHEDFFAVARFPEATIGIRHASPIAGATPGMPNYALDAVATIRGRTGPLAFPATVAPHEKGVAVQAHFDLDRTKWGATYGSGRLYHRLGGHLVNDAVSLAVRLIAKP